MIRAIIFAFIVLSNIVSVSCQCENSHAGCAGEGNYDPIIFNDAPSPSSEKRTVKKRITVKPKSEGIQATVYMARCEKIMSTHGLDAHITCEVQNGDENVYGWCINSTCTVCIGSNKELKHHADMAISKNVSMNRWPMTAPVRLLTCDSLHQNYSWQATTTI